MKNHDFGIQSLNGRGIECNTDYTATDYGVFANYIYICTEMIFNTNLNLDVKEYFYLMMKL